MKTALITMLLTLWTTGSDAIESREILHKSTINTGAIGNALYLSSFYTAALKGTKDTVFEYTLKSGIQNSQFNHGIYKATAFQLVPKISANATLPHRLSVQLNGPCVVNEETISFKVNLKSGSNNIGTVDYSFNLYQLPIRKNYNPKVRQIAECLSDLQVQAVEIRNSP